MGIVIFVRHRKIFKKMFQIKEVKTNSNEI